MSYLDVSRVDRASRTQSGWSLAGLDGRTHIGAVIAAIVPAAGILAAAAAFLVSLN